MYLFFYAGFYCIITKALPCYTIPYYTILCHIMPYHTISYYSVPYHTISYHTTPYHIVLCCTSINQTGGYFSRALIGSSDTVYPRITTSRRNFQNGTEEEIRQMNEEATPANTKSTCLVKLKQLSPSVSVPSDLDNNLTATDSC